MLIKIKKENYYKFVNMNANTFQYLLIQPLKIAQKFVVTPIHYLIKINLNDLLKSFLNDF